MVARPDPAAPLGSLGPVVVTLQSDDVLHHRDVVGQRRRVLNRSGWPAVVERRPLRLTLLPRRSCAGAARRRTLAAWTRSHTTIRTFRSKRRPSDTATGS